jgi:hypothetical protein
MTQWRKATWAFAIWNLLGVLWTVSYLNGIGDCSAETGNGLVVCQAGRAIGIELGFPLIVSVWAIGLLVFGLIWLLTRRTNA